ncbi:MAG: hypothetical protein ACRC62_34945, partial [Microcoleus sp.]
METSSSSFKVVEFKTGYYPQTHFIFGEGCETFELRVSGESAEKALELINENKLSFADEELMLSAQKKEGISFMVTGSMATAASAGMIAKDSVWQRFNLDYISMTAETSIDGLS